MIHSFPSFKTDNTLIVRQQALCVVECKIRVWEDMMSAVVSALIYLTVLTRGVSSAIQSAPLPHSCTYDEKENWCQYKQSHNINGLEWTSMVESDGNRWVTTAGELSSQHLLYHHRLPSIVHHTVILLRVTYLFVTVTHLWWTYPI